MNVLASTEFTVSMMNVPSSPPPLFPSLSASPLLVGACVEACVEVVCMEANSFRQTEI